VLLEKPGTRVGQLVGRSPYLQPVQVMAPASLIGEIVSVTITEVGTNSLFGALAGTSGGSVASSQPHESREPERMSARPDMVIAAFAERARRSDSPGSGEGDRTIIAGA